MGIPDNCKIMPNRTCSALDSFFTQLLVSCSANFLNYKKKKEKKRISRCYISRHSAREKERDDDDRKVQEIQIEREIEKGEQRETEREKETRKAGWQRWGKEKSVVCFEGNSRVTIWEGETLICCGTILLSIWGMAENGKAHTCRNYARRDARDSLEREETWQVFLCFFLFFFSRSYDFSTITRFHWKLLYFFFEMIFFFRHPILRTVV